MKLKKMGFEFEAFFFVHIENKNQYKKTQTFTFEFLTSDLDRIQTCNPQSRNLIFYSVELRSQKCKTKLKYLKTGFKC
jgi:hypothetical protein